MDNYMSILTLVQELGEDADLLVRHDDWLEAERKSKAAELDRAANELRAIMLAQKIKRALQQKNLVAVQQILKDTDGKVVDIIIKILNLPDALSLLSTSQYDTLDQVNFAAQLSGWDNDGYDIATSASLRSA